ncbi:MAG: hypothetical protein CSB19_01600 [Clostridiales bacterium]|nr:MAG: hypothetical protein CSB19_01600 [Clostridiales bacterium]
MKKCRFIALLALVALLIACSEQAKSAANDEIEIREEDGVYYSQFAKFDVADLQDFDVSRTDAREIKAFLSDVDKAILNVSEYLDRPDWQQRYLGKYGVEDTLYIDIELTNGISRVHYPPLLILCNAKLYDKNHLPMTHEITHIICPNKTSRSLREGLAQYTQAKFAPQNLLFVGDAPVHQVVKHYFATLNGEVFDAILNAVGSEMGKIDISAFSAKENRAVFYNLSYSFVKYLIDQYGIEKFMTLYNAEDLAAGYRAAYDADYKSLIEEWVSFIEKSE